MLGGIVEPLAKQVVLRYYMGIACFVKGNWNYFEKRIENFAILKLFVRCKEGKGDFMKKKIKVGICLKLGGRV